MPFSSRLDFWKCRHSPVISTVSFVNLRILVVLQGRTDVDMLLGRRAHLITLHQTISYAPHDFAHLQQVGGLGTSKATADTPLASRVVLCKGRRHPRPARHVGVCGLTLAAKVVVVAVVSVRKTHGVWRPALAAKGALLLEVAAGARGARRGDRRERARARRARGERRGVRPERGKGAAGDRKSAPGGEGGGSGARGRLPLQGRAVPRPRAAAPRRDSPLEEHL